MLVLTRKRQEEIVIGGIVRVVVVEVRGDRVRIGVEAPREVEVNRLEVEKAKQRGKDKEKDDERSH